MRALASKDFDAFVTVDRNLSFQQNLPAFSIAAIVLRAVSNRLADLQPLIPKWLESILFDDFTPLFEPKEIGGIVHGYAWALFQYKTKSEFAEAIERMGLRCYIADTSMGLYGFVVCKHATRVLRRERAVVV